MTADRRDPALETLFLPFETGMLTWPAEGGALFLRARDGWPLRQQIRRLLAAIRPGPLPRVWQM